MTNKTDRTNKTNTSELKNFIAGFNFDNSAWHRLPTEFPNVDETGLTDEDKATLTLIKVEWERAGRPKANKTNKTYTTYMSYRNKPHGGYRNLEAFKMVEILYDFTMEFIRTYRSNRTYKTYMTYKTCEQIEGAVRSGKQNIAEGSQRAAVSPTTEIQLVDVSRSSLEELLQDFLDFLRKNHLPVWGKDDPRIKGIRQLAYKTNKTYTTYMFYMSNPESAANGAITLIKQSNYLLDRLLLALKKPTVKELRF